MRFLRWILLGFCIISLGEKTTAQFDQCLRTFTEFSYQGPLARLQTDGIATPTSPWTIADQIPPVPFEESSVAVGNPRIHLSRTHNSRTEIWLSGWTGSFDSGRSRIFVVFQPESKNWQYIEHDIRDTNYSVDAIFTTSDGVIWGITRHSSIQDHQTNLPIISKFNEVRKQFEMVKSISLISMPQIRSRFSPRVILDQNDIFWFFASNEGIYRYNPETSNFNKIINLDLSIDNVTLSTNGTIYFDNDQSYFLDNTMFQFLPDTQEVVTVETPGESWPIYNGLLVDDSNRLWLGSTGYRDENGNWYLLHPDPELFFDHLGEPLWAPPEILTQTSDGRIWYRKYLDSYGFGEGTAWYDPDTGEGCLITNWPSNVVEDDERNLWILVEDTLYRRSLDSE